MECISQFECGAQLTCVAGQCVGPQVEGESYALYKSEVHNRLVSECGVCHAAAAQSEQPVTPIDENEDAKHTAEIDDPFGLPTYTAALGDSGWRIYINDTPTEEQLLASYRDTLQYINLEKPEQSLLFVYGRGDAGVSVALEHPKLYPTAEELTQDEGGESPFGVDYVGYQRLISWAALPHSDPSAVVYDLDLYKEYADNMTSSCYCHTMNEDEEFSRAKLYKGGFGVKWDAKTPGDLSPVTALLNLEDPPSSAFVRFAYGEFDHYNIRVNLTPEKEAKVIEWISRVATQMGVIPTQE